MKVSFFSLVQNKKKKLLRLTHTRTIRPDMVLYGVGKINKYETETTLKAMPKACYGTRVVVTGRVRKGEGGGGALLLTPLTSWTLVALRVVHRYYYRLRQLRPD